MGAAKFKAGADLSMGKDRRKMAFGHVMYAELKTGVVGRGKQRIISFDALVDETNCLAGFKVKGFWTGQFDFKSSV